MTRKDYKIIAGALLAVHDDYYLYQNCEQTDTPYEVLQNVIAKLADELKADNGSFDRSKFHTAASGDC